MRVRVDPAFALLARAGRRASFAFASEARACSSRRNSSRTGRSSSSRRSMSRLMSVRRSATGLSLSAARIPRAPRAEPWILALPTPVLGMEPPRRRTQKKGAVVPQNPACGAGLRGKVSDRTRTRARLDHKEEPYGPRGCAAGSPVATAITYDGSSAPRGGRHHGIDKRVRGLRANPLALSPRIAESKVTGAQPPLLTTR
jgi:hypothetical protein